MARLLTAQQQRDTALDYDLLADQLAWRIGHSDTLPAGAIALDKLPAIAQPPTAASPLHPLLQEVPLFTPLLGEERFVVQQWLDRLRQQGWLQSIDLTVPSARLPAIALGTE